jgi:hypothetical protein
VIITGLVVYNLFGGGGRGGGGGEEEDTHFGLN